MKLIDKDYNINISYERDQDLATYLERRKEGKICLVSDDKVYGIYKERIKKILSGFEYKVFVLKNGEESKSFETYKACLEFLLENKFTRSDMIIAFGGGVVGDLAAFVAASYLRGIDLVSVPTSLLAMVDSSVGGKCGINLAGYKNQVGAFYFPKSVHIDYSFLKSLEDREIKSGIGEIIKYGILADKELIELLNNMDLTSFKEKNTDVSFIIKKSLEIKSNFVRGDERDKGKRMFLNLGHTLAHALEPISEFKLSHGEAVAIGLLNISRAAFKSGLTDKLFYRKIDNLLENFSMAKDYNFDKEDLIFYLDHDKKVLDGKINLILPLDIAEPEIKKIQLDEALKLMLLGRE